MPPGLSGITQKGGGLRENIRRWVVGGSNQKTPKSGGTEEILAGERLLCEARERELGRGMYRVNNNFIEKKCSFGNIFEKNQKARLTIIN